MSMPVAVKNLQLPLNEEAVRALRAGDTVSLSGEIVITAGLPTHQRMVDCLNAGAPLPIDMQGQALLHLGGYSQLRDGAFHLLYLNPTTSTRFNPFMPTLIRGLGLRVTGGKGGLDEDSVSAMRERGCVYLSFIGGGCTVLSESIRQVISVGWSDLPIHYRLVKLRVEGLGPATVGIDAHGASLYGRGTAEALRRLPDIIRRLKDDRDAAQAI